jgi:hypothetical protein
MSQNSPYTASLIEILDGNPENLPSALLDLSQRVIDKTKGEPIPRGVPLDQRYGLLGSLALQGAASVDRGRGSMRCNSGSRS